MMISTYTRVPIFKSMDPNRVLKTSLKNPISSIVKVNRIMKKVLQNFGCILSALFVMLNIICNLEVNLAGFRTFWQKTLSPVCHLATSCLPH